MTLEKILLLSSIVSCSDYSITKKESKEQTEYTKEDIASNPRLEESCVNVDTFTVYHPCVDIIAVVDTSGSMYDATNNEIGQVQSFLSNFTRERLEDYPNPMMMVITAETNPSEYDNSPITLADAKNTTWILEETSGTTEAPLEALINYGKSESASWMREECSLSIMMFSDEDDQSYSQFSLDTIGDDGAVDLFLNDLTATFDAQETKEIYFTTGINPTREYQCFLMAEANQVGYRFEQIAAYYGGNINDLCNPYEEWNIHEIPSTVYEGWPLTYTPNPKTIVVYIDGNLSTRACSYDNGSVFYDYEENLTNGTEIQISYEIDTTKYPDQECPL